MTELSLPSRARTPRASTQETWAAAVDLVVTRMRSQPHAPLDLADMAGLAGVSRWHFDRVFRTVTGISPRQFQTALRLHEASRLLLTTRRSVTDVCLDVGYESLGSFITKFTETFGMPPQRLRDLSAVAGCSWSDLDWRPPSQREEQGLELHGNVLLDRIIDVVLVFVGAFATAMPSHAPLACTILRAAGPFTIPAMPRHPTRLFAVAVPLGDRPLDFLLNEDTARGGGLLVAPPFPIITLALRRPRNVDPPINLALPYLMLEHLTSVAPPMLSRNMESSRE
jgi:AraC-like DNA-binding protein